MSRLIRWSIVALLCLLVAGLGLRWWADDGERFAPMADEAVLDGLERLADSFPAPDDAEPAWPRDHGTRAEQFVESWLFAGLLEAEDGERYGFQLAFSRLAVQPGEPERESAWATRDVYRGRLSVEPAGRAANLVERISRDGLGLAGAEHSPARTWIEDWSFEFEEGSDGFVLRAADAEVGVDLRLNGPGTLPLVIDRPLYRGFWWPGLEAEGVLQIDGRRVPVAGRAMLDRLWGRALPSGRGQMALARLWLEDGEGGAIRCEHLQRKAGGGTPLLDCLGYPEVPRHLVLQAADGGLTMVAGRRFPLWWEARWSGHARPLRVMPLSSRHRVTFDAVWAGVVAADGRQQAWGVLELSNFAAR
jgi:predicted secreted hydrolase